MRHKEPYLVRNIHWILVVILFIKIAGYFSITDVKIITQIFKVISRVGMTMLTGLILLRLKNMGCINAMKIKNSMAVILYLLYLGLGFVSFTWSTDPK